mmetsp:Transcript_31916/g.78962  ORF Transcript_31916/g.78962 Transcript_31916/m.78962 type:complete len:149 (+) Transcript_31916:223-669(+)|eukprot:CAMPEP_0197590964 /NCGR_PEP_ID=MMETSP1326-20131121/12355_1 /TAXON_ID=1155430 /ORGANISM="Genus nov. species nov., Strain RCC2288" /LENGTH=148 /DNA_ID=CAMNT_0043156283 /DNA_START=174 /DNA_END=620 /DNA_ORIENTATION=+
MSGLACTRKKEEEEDATQLKLGPDFNDKSCLSMAEVRLICQSKVDDDEETGTETNTTQTRTFEKTLAYVRRFGGDTNAQAAGTLRELCQARGLQDFETAAITNLAPQNFEEAKTLVPSMEAEHEGAARFGDADIQALLDEMSNVRKFE